MHGACELCSVRSHQLWSGSAGWQSWVLCPEGNNIAPTGEVAPVIRLALQMRGGNRLWVQGSVCLIF